MQRSKTVPKTNGRIVRRRDLASRVAEIHGVTADYVRKVMRGDRENEIILNTCMQIIENDNLLLQAVKEILPIS